METRKNHLNTWDKVMMAITFAEAGDAKAARDMMRQKSKNRKVSVNRPQLRV